MQMENELKHGAEGYEPSSENETNILEESNPTDEGMTTRVTP